MRFAKASKFISILLALTMLLGTVPTMLGLSALAEENSLDYSSLADKDALKIGDYTELGMLDGNGLAISSGALITDKIWFDEALADGNINATGAYAVYGITPNSTLSVKFTDTTNAKRMKLYFSENGVDWFNAEDAEITGSVLKCDPVPDYANYAKIQWPASDSPYNGLISVDLNSAQRVDAVYNYSANAGDENLPLDSTEAEAYKSDLGIYKSSGNLVLTSDGTVKPNPEVLKDAAIGSFKAYAVYAVQPGTRFGLTVTGDRAASDYAELFGKEPNDFKVEIYGSSDGETYRKLYIEPQLSARYANGGSEKTDRSADYVFSVPDDVNYIKCSFPVTGDCSALKENAEAVGESFFAINRVEFTPLTEAYEATQEETVTETLDFTAYAKKNIKDIYGELDLIGFSEKHVPYISDNFGFTGNWTYLNGLAEDEVGEAPFAVWEVGENIKVTFKFNVTEGFRQYYGDIRVETASTSDFADAVSYETENLGINVEKKEESKFWEQYFYGCTFTVPAGHKFVRVTFPNNRKYSDEFVGNDAFGILSMSVEIPVNQTVDFTALSGSVDSCKVQTNADYYSQTHILRASKAGLTADYAYLNGSSDSGEKPYAIWRVKSGRKVGFTFGASDEGIAFYGQIKVETASTPEFTDSVSYTVGEGYNSTYTCSLLVPSGHKYVKVTLPNGKRYSESVVGDNMFSVKSMTVSVVSAIETETTDFASVSGDVKNHAKALGIVDYSTETPLWANKDNGLGGTYDYYNALATETVVEKPYAVWEAEEGCFISFKFKYMPSVYDFYGDITVETAKTLDFTDSVAHKVEYSSTYKSGYPWNGAYYVSTFVVPAGHKYVRVTLPMDRKYNGGVSGLSSYTGNDAYGILSMTVEKTKEKSISDVYTETVDFTEYSGKLSVNAEALGIVDYAKEHTMNHNSDAGICGDGSYLSNLNGATGQKPYAVWEAEEGRFISFKFKYMPSVYDFYGDITVETAKTLDFTDSVAHKVEFSSTYNSSWPWNGAYYVSTFVVPAGHKYVRVTLPMDRKYNGGVSDLSSYTGNDAYGILSMTVEKDIRETVDFTAIQSKEPVSNIADSIGAVDCSKDNKLYAYNEGLAASWGYLYGRNEPGEKPYVVFKAFSGQEISFNLRYWSQYASDYGDITVETASTLSFSDSVSKAASQLSGDTYTCTVKVSDGHKFVKVTLPNDMQYIAGDSNAGNDRFAIKSMTYTSWQYYNSEVTVTDASALGEDSKCAYGSEISNAGILFRINYSDGTSRITDSGFAFTEFDSTVAEGNVIASYKGIDIPVTVKTEAPVGDLNGDNKVDIVDFVRIKKIAANVAVSDGADADITGDGEVKAIDITILKQHILGIISVL